MILNYLSLQVPKINYSVYPQIITTTKKKKNPQIITTTKKKKKTTAVYRVVGRKST